MSKPKSKRLKTDAADFPVPTDRDSCAAQINQIRITAQQIEALTAAMNDEIGHITDAYTGQFTPLQERLKKLQKGVQMWCESNRDELTQGGKTKTAQFLTGIVQWRKRPDSVIVKGVDAVIETLERLGLDRFVRSKKEINKEAILGDKPAIAGIAGLSIRSSVEDFVIEPYELKEGDIA